MSFAALRQIEDLMGQLTEENNEALLRMAIRALSVEQVEAQLKTVLCKDDLAELAAGLEEAAT